MTDAECMRRCLELAERGRCVVGNGAMVGAVLVRSGKVIAEGFHKGFGKPHAERQLLEKFEQKIDSTDTLYVNLEPCVAHKTKKNPPCSDIILEKGIKRVVYGPVGNHHVAEMQDISGREFLFLALLALCVLGMGLYPFPFTEVMHASVDNLLKHVAVSKL
jgi:pyrimidine deaminase RibD-like protein